MPYGYINPFLLLYRLLFALLQLKPFFKSTNKGNEMLSQSYFLCMFEHLLLFIANYAS